jgi:Xaa-Pro aminopeptidase
MRKSALWCALAFVTAAFATDPIPRDEYHTRRAELRKKLDGVLVLFGYAEGPDEVYRVGQNSNFYYLTGWTEPGAIVMLTPAEEILFLPHRNARREVYNGKRVAPDDANAPASTGFDSVQGTEKLEASLQRALDSYGAFYAIADPANMAKLKALAPFREVAEGAHLLAPLRMKKSPAEIAAIRHTTDVSMEAHRSAWKRLNPGMYEYQAAATFAASLLEAGCEGQSYEPIFGSGPNSTTLHYSANSRRMDSGEVIVIDAAAKCGGYASDITRTLPINGKFTPRQRELYLIVLGAQQAVIDAIKPGVPATDLTRIAREYLDKQGKDKDGKPLSKYLPHGVSHPVGLDVHDAAVMTAKLEAGMVITVEPGLYLPDENIGIRIEDVVLVTEKGATILSGALPRSPDEVEKALAK